MATATPQTTTLKVPVKPKQKTAWDHAEPFVLGGLSGMFATAIIQPMDMVKVRQTKHAQTHAHHFLKRPRDRFVG